MAGSLSVREKNAAAAKKRRFEADAATKRENQSRSSENLSALGSGVASIPRRVVNYIKTSTPSGVLQDVKDIASSTYDAAAEDPGQFAADAIFSPLAAIRDFGDVRAMARKLREQGRNAEAEKLEAMAGVSILSAIPIVGKVAGTAVRDAEQAALRGAVRGAERGAVGEGRAVLGMSGAPKQLALPAPSPKPPSYAVKPRGGQWWSDKGIGAMRQSDLGVKLTKFPDTDTWAVRDGGGRLKLFGNEDEARARTSKTSLARPTLIGQQKTLPAGSRTTH